MSLLPVGIGSSGPTQHTVERSLRFNSADSAYLNRTFASAGNRRTWTYSAWVKRVSSGTTQHLLRTNQTPITLLRFEAADSLYFYSVGVSAELRTTAVYRDFSAWYHVVWSVDTTQATASNRIKLYVNGVQVTAFSTETYPSQNTELGINTASAHAIGATTTPDEFANQYLADVFFIDGQALTPSSFGENDTDTGVWKPKAYSGTYGTNGFYLKFADNSGTTSTTLGKDSSGNGNNWTPNNFSVTAGAGNDSLVDTPTPYGSDTGVGGEVRGNYATLNPLNAKLGTGSLANGNLQFNGPSGSAAYNFTGGTFSIDTSTSVGWYFEVTQTTYGAFAGVSLLDNSVYVSSLSTDYAIGYSGNSTSGITYRNSGDISDYGTYTTGLTTWQTSGDVIGVAIKNNKIWFSKNGTWISGDPGAGTSPSITLASTKFVSPAGTGINGNVFNYNFGQRPFAYTAPSGFKALCTTNLPTPAIGATSTTRADDYFNTVLYTGNGTTNNISGVGFNPDFVWIKNRSVGGRNHYLFDRVRGITNGRLMSNTTNAEDTSTTYINSTNSDGYQLAAGDAGSNGSGETYVGWNWAANGTGVSNTQGTITSTVSANTTSGFSIVTATCASGTNSYGHGLGVKPAMYIVKNRSQAQNWQIWHKSLSNETTAFIQFNTAGEQTYSTMWAASTSTTISLVSGGPIPSGDNFVAYVFAEVAGYSAFGSYTGNGSADGPFVYTNFRPAWLLIKRSSTTGDWILIDAKRSTYNISDERLSPNLSEAESGNDGYGVDFLSNGFKLRTSLSVFNGSGQEFVYAAFAENPFRYSLAR